MIYTSYGLEYYKSNKTPLDNILIEMGQLRDELFNNTDNSSAVAIPRIVERAKEIKRAYNIIIGKMDDSKMPTHPFKLKLASKEERAKAPFIKTNSDLILDLINIIKSYERFYIKTKADIYENCRNINETLRKIVYKLTNTINTIKLRVWAFN